MQRDELISALIDRLPPRLAGSAYVVDSQNQLVGEIDISDLKRLAQGGTCQPDRDHRPYHAQCAAGAHA